MYALAIVIEGHDVSEAGFKQLVKSSNDVNNPFKIDRWDATTAEDVPSYLSSEQIMWNWPITGDDIEISSGLRKKAYAGNVRTRAACAISHHRLWRLCVDINDPILVLEHDAKFIKQLTLNPRELTVPILGINDPRNATRKALVFHEKLQASKDEIQLVPHVDTDPTIPHGLAGNSAYIITPKGAKALLELVRSKGLWPNDAIMCRQLIPQLSTTRTYYTTVQGLPSTTVV